MERVKWPGERVNEVVKKSIDAIREGFRLEEEFKIETLALNHMEE